MSKTKDKTRPRYICPKGHCSWVDDKNPYCMICGAVGVPQNRGAEKTVRKLKEE